MEALATILNHPRLRVFSRDARGRERGGKTPSPGDGVHPLVPFQRYERVQACAGQVSIFLYTFQRSNISYNPSFFRYNYLIGAREALWNVSSAQDIYINVSPGLLGVEILPLSLLYVEIEV